MAIADWSSQMQGSIYVTCRVPPSSYDSRESARRVFDPAVNETSALQSTSIFYSIPTLYHILLPSFLSRQHQAASPRPCPSSIATPARPAGLPRSEAVSRVVSGCNSGDDLQAPTGDWSEPCAHPRQSSETRSRTAPLPVMSLPNGMPSISSV